MTSKNLYFKLMKEDLKSRLWAVSLIGLGSFFLYPVVVAFFAGEIKNQGTFELGMKWYSTQVTDWLSFNNGMTVFVMMLTALILGLSGFSYLDSKSKVDFYHSIPVKREKLFITNYINGILMLAVPYAVSMALAVLVGISNGVDGAKLWQVAGAAYLLHLTYFILMYTTVVIAVMMTGNLVVAFLGCMVFSFYVPLAVNIIQGYFGTFFDTYVWYAGSKFVENGTRISPVLEYMYQFSRYVDGESIWAAAAAALAVSAVLAVLGCVLYRKRPSEAAGKAMAFAVSRPVIRILITLLSAMSLGVFFWSMRESTGWAVFGVLCGAAISHCVIEIIYHFDFKKLFANKTQLIVCTLVSLAVLFIFRYDVIGYDRYLPNAGDVRGAAVEVTGLNPWVSYGETQHLPDGGYDWEDQASLKYVVEHMDYTDVENLLAIAASGIAETETNEKYQTERHISTGELDPELSGTYAEAIICYTLKGGRKAYRRYYLDLDHVMPQIEALYASMEYQQGTFPMMNLRPEDVAEIYYSEAQKETRLSGLTDEEKSVILKTYQKEFAAMTPSQMKTEFPLGLIRFTTQMDEAGLQWWDREEKSGFKNYPRYEYRGGLSYRGYYPIYPSFKETLKLLAEKQIDAGSFYRDMDIQSVSIRWYRHTETYDGYREASELSEILITDPAEIAQLKQVMVESGRKYYNQLFPVSDVDVDISVLENGGTYEYGAIFPRGKVPEFVKERLKAAKVK